MNLNLRQNKIIMATFEISDSLIAKQVSESMSATFMDSIGTMLLGIIKKDPETIYGRYMTIEECAAHCGMSWSSFKKNYLDTGIATNVSMTGIEVDARQLKELIEERKIIIKNKRK